MTQYKIADGDRMHGSPNGQWLLLCYYEQFLKYLQLRLMDRRFCFTGVYDARELPSTKNKEPWALTKTNPETPANIARGFFIQFLTKDYNPFHQYKRIRVLYMQKKKNFNKGVFYSQISYIISIKGFFNFF